jgi:hypothetical protein
VAISHDAKIGIVVGVILAALTASSAPWWWRYVDRHPAKPAVTPPPAVAGMSGGCEPFQVYAQNRWLPIGVAIRAQPNVLLTQIGSYPANMSISVNGWVHGRAAYTTNPPPWNSDIWYHLTDGAGWVSFPGVRAYPTAYDPTGHSPDGGPAVATSATCEGAVN